MQTHYLTAAQPLRSPSFFTCKMGVWAAKSAHPLLCSSNEGMSVRQLQIMKHQPNGIRHVLDKHPPPDKTKPHFQSSNVNGTRPEVIKRCHLPMVLRMSLCIPRILDGWPLGNGALGPFLRLGCLSGPSPSMHYEQLKPSGSPWAAAAAA